MRNTQRTDLTPCQMKTILMGAAYVAGFLVVSSMTYFSLHQLKQDDVAIKALLSGLVGGAFGSAFACTATRLIEVEEARLRDTLQPPNEQTSLTRFSSV